MTSGQKRELIREQLKATPEQSDRQIAQALGVDKNTVNTQRKQLEATGEIHQFETNIGADGKERPRKVNRKKSVVSVFNPTKREERAVRESCLKLQVR